MDGSWVNKVHSPSNIAKLHHPDQPHHPSDACSSKHFTSLHSDLCASVNTSTMASDKIRSIIGKKQRRTLAGVCLFVQSTGKNHARMANLRNAIFIHMYAHIKSII